MEHTDIQQGEEDVHKIAENLQLYDGGRELIVSLGDTRRSRPKCKFCEQSFSSTKTLKIHLRDKHGDTSEMKEKQVACLELGCEYRCRVIDDLTKHLATEHGREFTQEQYKFDSWDMFLQWKEETERDCRCTFIKMGGHQHRGGDFEKLYYYCSRTGFYRSRGATSRRMKQQGTKKLGGYCTAKMVVYVTKLSEAADEVAGVSRRSGASGRGHMNSPISQRIDVFFTREHYGHIFELKHLTLSKTERSVIVEMLKQRLTAEEILKELRDATRTEEELERINLVTRKDISNIARQYSLPYVYSRGRTHSTGSEDGGQEHDFGISSGDNEQQPLPADTFYSNFDENGEIDGMREVHEQGMRLAVSEVAIDETNGRITLVQQVTDADADAEQPDAFGTTTYACTVTLLSNSDEPHACDAPQCADCDYACVHRYSCDCFEYSSLRTLCVHTHFVHAYLKGTREDNSDRRQLEAVSSGDAELAGASEREHIPSAGETGHNIIDVSALVSGAPGYCDTDPDADADADPPYSGSAHYVDSAHYAGAYAYEGIKTDDDAADFYTETTENVGYGDQAEAAAVGYEHYAENDAQAAGYAPAQAHSGKAQAAVVDSELINCTPQFEAADLRSQVVDRLESLRQVVSNANADTLNALLSRLSDVSGLLDTTESVPNGAIQLASQPRTSRGQSATQSRGATRGLRIVHRSNAADPSTPAAVSQSSVQNIVAITPSSRPVFGSAYVRKVMPISVNVGSRNEAQEDGVEPVAKIARVSSLASEVMVRPTITRVSRQEAVTMNTAPKRSMIIRVVEQQQKGQPGAGSSSSVPDAALNVEVQ